MKDQLRIADLAGHQTHIPGHVSRLFCLCTTSSNRSQSQKLVNLSLQAKIARWSSRIPLAAVLADKTALNSSKSIDPEVSLHHIQQVHVNLEGCTYTSKT